MREISFPLCWLNMTWSRQTQLARSCEDSTRGEEMLHVKRLGQHLGLAWRRCGEGVQLQPPESHFPVLGVLLTLPCPLSELKPGRAQYWKNRGETPLPWSCFLPHSLCFVNRYETHSKHCQIWPTQSAPLQGVLEPSFISCLHVCGHLCKTFVQSDPGTCPLRAKVNVRSIVSNATNGP